MECARRCVGGGGMTASAPVSTLARDFPYLGLTAREAAAALGYVGLSNNKVLQRLSSKGYRVGANGRLDRSPNATEVEDAITARIAALPVSSGPCFRCGGRICACTTGRRP